MASSPGNKKKRGSREPLPSNLHPEKNHCCTRGYPQEETVLIIYSHPMFTTSIAIPELAQACPAGTEALETDC